MGATVSVPYRCHIGARLCHEVTDTPDTLDYERMAHVVTGVYAAVTRL